MNQIAPGTTDSSSAAQTTERTSWTTPREALHLIRQPRHLKSALRVALVVGTVLFLINQLDVLLGGHANVGHDS
jgi:hypothetical protein